MTIFETTMRNTLKLVEIPVIGSLIREKAITISEM